MKNFINIIVSHRKYGIGVVKRIEENHNESFITIEFFVGEKEFKFPSAFGTFLTLVESTPEFDKYLEEAIEQYKIKMEEKKKREEEEKKKKIEERIIDLREKKLKKTVRYRKKKISTGNGTFEIKRKEFRVIPTPTQMWELVGYLVVPGRLQEVKALIPNDKRVDDFKIAFPNQPLYVIDIMDSNSGIPSPCGKEMDLVITDTTNCPELLKKLIKSDVTKNQTLCMTNLVLELVTNYGLQFGKSQDVEKIKRLAEERGHLEAFNCGFNRKITRTKFIIRGGDKVIVKRVNSRMHFIAG